MTPEERLEIIGKACSQRQFEVSQGGGLTRREQFSFFESIRFLVDKSDHFIELNREEIEKALGVKLNA